MRKLFRQSTKRSRKDKPFVSGDARHDHSAQALLQLEALESRVLLNASLELVPMADGASVFEENGMTVIQVLPGTEIDVSVNVNPTTSIDSWQLNFASSDLGMGMLELGNWLTNAAWNADDGTLNSALADIFVSGTGAAINTNTPLGSFTVAAPTTSGDYTLTADANTVYTGTEFYSLFLNRLEELIETDPEFRDDVEAIVQVVVQNLLQGATLTDLTLTTLDITAFDGTPTDQFKGVNIKKFPFVWDPTNGKFLIGQVEEVIQTDGANGLLLDPDDPNILYIGGQNDEIYKVNLTTQQIEATAVLPTDFESFQIAFSPDGQSIITSNQPDDKVSIVPRANFGSGITTLTVTDSGNGLPNIPSTLTQVATAPALTAADANLVYYISGNRMGIDPDSAVLDTPGYFGIFDISTGEVTPLFDDSRSHRSVQYDPFTGDVFTFGNRFVRQYNITDPLNPTLESELDLQSFLANLPDAINKNLFADVDVAGTISGTHPLIGSVGPIPFDESVPNIDTGQELNVIDQGIPDGFGNFYLAVNTGHVVVLRVDAANGQIANAQIYEQADGKPPLLDRYFNDFSPVVDAAMVPGTGLSGSGGNVSIVDFDKVVIRVVQPSSIGDTVFNDANVNWFQDNNEDGFANVTLDLHRDMNNNSVLDAGDEYLDTQTTDGNGNYLFDNLLVGNYLIEVTDTNNVLDGFPATTPTGQLPQVGNYQITIEGQQIDSADFGFQGPGDPGSLGGTVFNDANANFWQDPGFEGGFANVTLDLFRDVNDDFAFDPSDPLVGTQTTDANGEYLFGNLPADNYFVRVTDTNNVVTGLPVTQDYPWYVTVTAGEEIDWVNFGFQGQGPLPDLMAGLSNTDDFGLPEDGSWGNGSINISSNYQFSQELTVFFDINGGDAVWGTDFDLSYNSTILPVGTDSVLIPENWGSAWIEVIPLNDDELEGDEGFDFTLVSDPAYTLAEPYMGTFLIEDDDDNDVSIQATQFWAAENGTSNGQFTITRTGPNDGPLEVMYEITGTATMGTDFQDIDPMSITIPANENSVTIDIIAFQDNLVEGDFGGGEEVTLTVVPKQTYSVAPFQDTAQVFIQDDDFAFEQIYLVSDDWIGEDVPIVVGEPQAPLGNPLSEFWFIRFSDFNSPQTDDTIEVFFSVTGTATWGTDFQLLQKGKALPVGTDSFSFPPPPNDNERWSDTFKIKALDDSEAEGPETITIAIEAGTNYRVDFQGTLDFAIFDGDGGGGDLPVVEIVAADANAAEKNLDPGQFTFSRTGPTDSDLVVHFDFDGSAVRDVDYGASIQGNTLPLWMQQVVIPQGFSSVTVDINPFDDIEEEGGELIIFELVPTFEYIPGASAFAAIDLADDDVPPAGSIGNDVFLDANSNGIQEPKEPGIPGVSVSLYADTNSNGLLDLGIDLFIAQQVTDFGGEYDFTGLEAGRYIVEVDETIVPLVGAVNTTGNNPLAVILASDQNFNDADFGYLPPDGSIGDTVFIDANNNGIQDKKELGISGITVSLYVDANSNGVLDGPDQFLISQITDDKGKYDFVGLVAGGYIVEVDETAPVLQKAINSTNNNPLSVILAANNEDFDDADFGYIPPEGSIGDTVFLDTNDDGVQGKKEPGILGVTVSLYADSNNNGTLDGPDQFLTSQGTDADGEYNFLGLEAGNYIVDVEDTSGPLAGFVNTTDNDPLAVTLATNDSVIDTADFGYYDPNNLVFGVVGDTTISKFEFRGTTYALAGGGWAQLSINGSGYMDVEFFATHAKSKAKLTAPKGQIADLGSVIVNGGLSAFDAKGHNLMGDFTADEAVLKLVFNRIDADHTITVGPGDEKAALSLTAKEVYDTSLISEIPLKKVAVETWEEIDGLQNVIRAPWAKAIQSKNNFEVDMILTDGSVKATLGNLNVARTISNAVIRSGGHIGSVSAGAMINSAMYGSVDQTLSDLLTSVDQLGSPDVTLKALKIKGIKDTPGIDTFANSILGFGNIGSATLGQVAKDNQGDSFGLTATNIKSVAYLLDGAKLKASKLDDATMSFGEEDFNVIIL
jgi:hypothetical protein